MRIDSQSRGEQPCKQVTLTAASLAALGAVSVYTFSYTVGTSRSRALGWAFNTSADFATAGGPIGAGVLTVDIDTVNGPVYKTPLSPIDIGTRTSAGGLARDVGTPWEGPDALRFNITIGGGLTFADLVSGSSVVEASWFDVLPQ